MADKKISALTAATTPLSGTEVLPIVQSGSTVKVANNDLRPKQIQSNATSGVLQVVGPAAAATRVMTVPDANFTAARTDAAQSFTGDQTLSTGNLVQGTAAKGINFTANTGAAGKTSQLLNWYEEGTFTPTLTYSTPGTVSVTYVSGSRKGYYTRVGNVVNIMIDLRIDTFSKGTASGYVQITGLPFTAKDTGGYGRSWLTIALNAAAFTGIPLAVVNSADTSITLLQVSTGAGQTSLSDPAAGASYYLSGMYLV